MYVYMHEKEACTAPYKYNCHETNTTIYYHK